MPQGCWDYTAVTICQRGEIEAGAHARISYTRALAISLAIPGADHYSIVVNLHCRGVCLDRLLLGLQLGVLPLHFHSRRALRARVLAFLDVASRITRFQPEDMLSRERNIRSANFTIGSG